MTEREEALLVIRDDIKDCFGYYDDIFALHPMDEGAANEIFNFAHKNKIQLDDIVKIAVEYLEEKQCPEEHIKKQKEKIREHFESL